MPKQVLITGGAGFIGSSLSQRLLSAGHRVRVLDCLASQVHGTEPEKSSLYLAIRDKVDFHRGSVTCKDDLIRALRDIDTVVHLAAETGTGQSMYAIRHYTDVNVGGTALLLDLIANHPFPVRKVIVASSRAVYGEGKHRCELHGPVYPEPRQESDMKRRDFSVHCPLCGSATVALPTDESTPVRPSSVYGITKLAQEQMVLTVGRALGISALAFRYQNVYGPGQSLTNPYTGILSIFSTRIRNGSEINVFEDGSESRDFVFVEDVVTATMRGIDCDDQLVDVFNVGSGVPTDVKAIASTLQELLGVRVPINISGQFRLGDIRHNFADLTKVRRVLGFEPAVAFAEGLEQFATWVNGEQVKEDRYEESLRELRSKGLFK